MVTASLLLPTPVPIVLNFCEGNLLIGKNPRPDMTSQVNFQSVETGITESFVLTPGVNMIGKNPGLDIRD